MNHFNDKGHAMKTRLCAPVLAALVMLAASPALAAPDLDFLASAGLGDELGGRPVAIDLAREGVVVASAASGQGTLVRLDAQGERTGPALALPGGVDDLAVDRGTGTVVVVGPTGLAVFDPELAPLWQRTLTTSADARRVEVRRVRSAVFFNHVSAVGRIRPVRASGHARPDRCRLQGAA